MNTPHNSCIVGLQWGDEGKGKIVDYLAGEYQYVVRYCGGANAGHSVHIDGQAEKFALHLIPCGLLRPGVVSIVGNGVVIDPAVVLSEMAGLRARQVDVTPENLRISYKAHVVMPWHQIEDGARESASAASAIGTTKRGIGPSYADKAHRSTAIRIADFQYPDELAAKIRHIAADRNLSFERWRQAAEQAGGVPVEPINVEAVVEQYLGYAEAFRPYIADTSAILLDALDAGKRLLFEGAHGFMLDIDHGTFPYVTSSNCSSLGACSGAGLPPQTIDDYLGVIKAYSTRVGGGPFPTEQDNTIGQRIRERGREYGTTTGRPRRCGWFDAVAVRYAVRMGGINRLALTLLDVLGGLDKISICRSYEVNGQELPLFHTDARVLGKVKPVFETLPGWQEEIGQARSFAELPTNCRAYVERIEQLLGVPVAMISVGPARGATIVR